MTANIADPRQTVKPALPPQAKGPPPLEPNMGGFWVRTAAHLVDATVFSFLVLPLLIGVYWNDLVAYFQETLRAAQLGGRIPNSMELTQMFHGPAGIVIQYVLPAIAVVILWKTRSATPGKMVCGLRIADARTYGRPSFGQCVIRAFGYVISMAPLCLGFIWVAFDPRKQGWHDKLAGTVVISTR